MEMTGGSDSIGNVYARRPSYPTFHLRPITISGTHFVDTVVKGERSTRVSSKLRFRNGISRHCPAGRAFLLTNGLTTKKKRPEVHRK